MSSPKKHFSVAKLKIGDNPFDLSYFTNLQDDVNNLTINGEIQQNIIIKKEIKENRFMLLYFEEGDLIPRPDVVYNRVKREDETNPRSTDQIERDFQLFVLVDVLSQKIYISDFRRKKEFENWLGEKIGKVVLMKNIIDREHFLNEIKSIDTIYLSATPNLFSNSGILGKELTSDHHNYGVGIKHIGVSIKFEKNELPELLKNQIRYFFKEKDNDAIKKLEISGRYDDKFERIFNAEGIVDRVAIEATPLKSGLLDRDEVFNNLILKIK